ncbi:hypothetical protein BS47DRAFT_1372154 [Hydnum rufescens UP504]|uniref:tRNA (adenine(58)-N(1))-methyltransferase non-catalytic subunit TRM6 n=1 Tax=Hydnum rufescens UP504 TaxID=1448309 RepID=A0A9P6B2C1_9AGAM|nr:hypothetical protein BS47DRAFT_1372154 [Hydnum rufescens UP504]
MSYLIKFDDIVLYQLPSGEIRSIKVDRKASANLGKYGSFPARELVGKAPGFTYDIVNGTLVLQPPQTLEELDDTDANNEMINDGAYVQPLTFDEIEALKKSGAHASVLFISFLLYNVLMQWYVAGHNKEANRAACNYELKTEYSKDKYKKRKEAKFSKQVTVIEPTMFNVCDYWFSKDPGRVRVLRPDTLGQILSYGNVQSSSRVLVVDDSGGLIIAAVLERLGGKGRVVAISDCAQAPAYPCVSAMNFSPKLLEPLVTSLNWAQIEEDWEPGKAPNFLHDYSETPQITTSVDSNPLQRKLDRESQRVSRRRQMYLVLQAAREELFSGNGMRGLIVASQYEPFSVVEKLVPYLGGSAHIVVQSPYLQVLTEAQSKMRSQPQYLAPNITESWLRKYQVLPGRTHPIMSASGSGGYILHTIKIYDNSIAKSTLVSERRIQRQKAAEAKRRKSSGRDC